MARAVSPSSVDAVSAASPSHIEACVPAAIASLFNDLFASNAPEIPASISPLPPRARAGQPRVCIMIVLPSEILVAADFNAIAHSYFLHASSNDASEASGASRRISPSCGVSKAGALRDGRIFTIGSRIASASSTAGSAGLRRRISPTSACVSGESESPQPASNALAAPSLSRTSPSASSAIAPDSSSGHPTQIADGSAAANAGASDSGTKLETSPAPARNAARVASIAAPGYLREPATMNRCPNVRLSEIAGRRVFAKRRISGRAILIAAPSNSVGASKKPISTYLSLPAHSRLCGLNKTSFAMPVAYVASARNTHSCGVSAAPEGMSIEIFMPARTVFAARIFSAADSLSGGVKLIPRMPSIARSNSRAVSISLPISSSGNFFASASRAFFVLGFIFAVSPQMTVILGDADFSAIEESAIRASPPLCPLPTNASSLGE